MDSVQQETEPQPRASAPAFRRPLWIFVLAAILIALLCSLPSREFRYQGKTFAQWYLGLTNNVCMSYRLPGFIPNPNQPLVETLQIYGSNAIPFFRSELSPDSPFKLKFIQFLKNKAWVPRIFIPRQHDPGRALMFVNALGPTAKDLLPDITKLFTNSSTPAAPMAITPKAKLTCQQYATALGAIGPDGFPPLHEALESPDLLRQEAAVYALARVAYDISPALPSLLRCLDSTNSAVVGQARVPIADILRKKPELLAPSLPHVINTLENGGTNNQLFAIWILGALGTNATSALPALQRVLTNSANENSRKALAEALRKIEPEGLN